MQYAICVYEPESEFERRQGATTAQEYWAAYAAYSKALVEAGVARGGAGLDLPSTATTVRVRASKRQVHDGPYADTRELLGGAFFIEVANLDEALSWAARCPGAEFGSVEVRPMLPPPPL